LQNHTVSTSIISIITIIIMFGGLLRKPAPLSPLKLKKASPPGMKETPSTKSPEVAARDAALRVTLPTIEECLCILQGGATNTLCGASI
jgi:hypothetical protein